jgi:hypothetical protein
VFDEFLYRPLEFVDTGQFIRVVGRMGGRAKGSGILTDGGVVHEWTIRNAMAIQLHAYPDTPEGHDWRQRLG